MFCASDVFCEAARAPGFVAREIEGGMVIPVFSSLEALAGFAAQDALVRFATRRTGWFSARGQDLLDLLPDGFDLLLDPGADHAIRLRAGATVRRLMVGPTPVRPALR
ncbi:SseB family protein [Spongiactinospora sp. TRM90649]|uniref:SseB family protein n=1 Tax=Spongiactinospora sp. TRM90649 TaxID=3031114 RepID=UPI0023F771FC|nr:SseB family protein [Spongiactinospora sp. TRM90649]MDF5751116.1 SseB family protein [Spongiactinospora sp. TRM90649]